MSKDGDKLTKCAEHGVWTDPPAPLSRQNPLDLSVIDNDECQQIVSSGRMRFAMVGCSGDPETQTNTAAVATAITADNDTSFFYHLGDLIYTEKGSDVTMGGSDVDETALWNSEFYAPYTKYSKRIVSVPGNHDGKSTPINDYLGAFCANASKWPAPWTGNTSDRRPAMIQPYVYWRLDTPLAYIVGLYSNIVNGGMLDDPAKYDDFRTGLQYQWLVGELKSVAAANLQNSPKKAVLLAVHYPPYSGASNFNVRGDPSQGPSPDASKAPYLAVALQSAFKGSGQRPDAIFSAHAHLFQRLTYAFADGTLMPCLIVGCGGHSPLEVLSNQCDGNPGVPQGAPFAAVTPGSFQYPEGDSAQLEYYEDGNSPSGEFGFLKVSIEGRTLKGQFVGATSRKPHDEFKLDLDNHKYL
jgi:hypothetical protein